ncbi:retrotransposon protein, putative, ty1-copia subclass [Tanacetum coccineum]
MGLQLLQLEIRLGKNPSRSFRPVKSAKILWQFWASCSLRVSLAHDGSWSKNEQKLHHLEDSLPEAPPATTVVRNAYTHRVAEQQEVACLMLVSMTPEIQKNLEDRTAFEILQELKTMFHQQAEQELFEIMERLGYPMPLVLGVNLILTSLLEDYDQFMQNYNMHGMGKTIPELHAMLKLVEKSIPKKAHVVLAIRQELKKNKASASGTSRIFTIKLFSFPKSNSWIYDTDCGTHICNTIQELIGYRKLNKGALDLYVGNRNTAVVEAIGSYELILPSGMIIKRIEKLQHDGLLKSIDDESFDVYVSCISRKMARKPFTHASERADDLLGIIHSDVCGPFRTTSREGGEYLSQEFLDHLRSRGIISQLTPPYTPQHNGVSERRNRTLLDMVRSMMSLTTLPMSFGGYALDSTTRILNMVPTKKVNKTPYEMWHGNVLNLSYLKEHELGDHGEYPNYRVALSDPESKKWLEAMNVEMQSMKDNQVWNLVDLPPNCNTVRSKWLFKKKTDMDGNIHTYKARHDIITQWENNIPMLQDVKSWLGKCFAMKDLGEATYILGIKIYRDRSRRLICLSQNTYIDKILKRFKMDTSKRGTIPMQSNVDLRKSQGPSTPAEVKRLKGVPYASAVGSIMYVVRCTRPDIAFSQNPTSRYQ